MNPEKYIMFLKEELISGKYVIRRDLRITYNKLERLIHNTSKVIGMDNFVSKILSPLMKLNEYVDFEIQFKIVTLIMRYFGHLNDERKDVFSEKVHDILINNINIAQRNRKMMKRYKFPDKVFKDSLFGLLCIEKHLDSGH